MNVQATRELAAAIKLVSHLPYAVRALSDALEAEVSSFAVTSPPTPSSTDVLLEEPPASGRELSQSPGAVRMRKRRAAQKGSGKGCRMPELDSSQLGLFDAPAHAERTRAHACADPMHTSSSNKQRMIMEPRTQVFGDPDDPPAWAFEFASSRRPELPEFEVRDLWRWFAKKAHRDENDWRDHWARLLRVHRVRSSGAADAATAAASAPPPSRVTPTPKATQRPTVAADAPSPRPTPRPTLAKPILERVETIADAEWASLFPAIGAAARGEGLGPPARASCVA